jgi:hypothetical protein
MRAQDTNKRAHQAAWAYRNVEKSTDCIEKRERLGVDAFEEDTSEALDGQRHLIARHAVEWLHLQPPPSHASELLLAEWAATLFGL